MCHENIRITVYQNIKTFLQRKRNVIPNWSEEVFVVKKVKNTVPWTLFLRKTFYEKDVVT